jgi:cytochrome c biogenesis protein CcmG/thiol:disulfide interchange protein DsbE
MSSRRAVNPTVALLFGLLFSWHSIAGEKLPKGIMQLDGRKAPALVLEDMDGEVWDIGEARGRWVFVHFWAAWCGPCRREMPTIQAIYPQFDSGELEIVVINTAESEDKVFAFLAGVAPDLNPLMDKDGLVTERWQPRGLPATFLVDPSGRLQYLALGGRPWDSPDYLKFLQKLIDIK